MRGFRTLLRWAVVGAAVLLATACDRQAMMDREKLELLTDGYWVTGTEGEWLMRFTEAGEVYYFHYARVEGEDRIEAYYDVAFQLHTQYAVDYANSYLCLLPDNTWFHILKLTDDALTLQAEGQQPVFYVKVRNSQVTMLTKEEFLEKYPSEAAL